jgi:hypothetical protein
MLSMYDGENKRLMSFHSELRYRGYKITVFTIPVPIDGSPSNGFRDAFVSVIGDSLDPYADVEDVPRDTPEETISSAKEMIDSFVEGEIDDVEKAGQ